jgi:signal transduction histidine kinase
VIVAPAIVVAVLGYVSLRQWAAAAEVLLREQARDVAGMAADKVTMALRMTQEPFLGRLQALLASDRVATTAIDTLLAETPLIRRLCLFDDRGELLYPASSREGDSPLVARLWAARGGVDTRVGAGYMVVGGESYVFVLLPTPRERPVLAVFTHDPEVLRREVLEPALITSNSPTILAVIDATGHPFYSRAPVEHAERLVSVAFRDGLPNWRLEVYQPPGTSPRQTVRRQVMLFTVAFGVLITVIVAGTTMTFRLIRRETEMARLKSDFVAHVSHDLKTPLSVIRMFAETLEMGRVKDEAGRHHYLGVISRESVRLSRLIDNVLDFSRIEEGRQRYDYRATAVEPLIRETLEAFTYPLTQLGFAVEVRVDANLPDVPLDADAIGQALANLIDNAIKYAAEGKWLTITARSDGRQLALTVADRGPGIPAGEQARIFEKFYRVGRSETQGRRGTGLGLALVRHIAEGHRGRVTVEGAPGEGSRFTLWLPLTLDA